MKEDNKEKGEVSKFIISVLVLDAVVIISITLAILHISPLIKELLDVVAM